MIKQNLKLRLGLFEQLMFFHLLKINLVFFHPVIIFLRRKNTSSHPRHALKSLGRVVNAVNILRPVTNIQFGIKVKARRTLKSLRNSICTLVEAVTVFEKIVRGSIQVSTSAHFPRF